MTPEQKKWLDANRGDGYQAVGHVGAIKGSTSEGARSVTAADRGPHFQGWRDMKWVSPSGIAAGGKINDDDILVGIRTLPRVASRSMTPLRE